MISRLTSKPATGTLAVLGAIGIAVMLGWAVSIEAQADPVADAPPSGVQDVQNVHEQAAPAENAEPAAPTRGEAVHGEPLGAHGSAEAAHGEAEGGHHGPDLGRELPLWSVIPFAGILLSIALFPLLAPHFWEHHFPKVSAFWALVFAIPFLVHYRGAAVHSIAHIYLLDYIPFIILLWGLFTVSGGIVVYGKLRGTPVLNAVLILIGTALASWIGTTGASMLLIRPLLRANAERKRKVHIVIFFIFLVSNIGGSLTPLGDPPLFLGFLHGVPFFWTFALMPHMVFCFFFLLVLFYFIDRRYYLQDCDDEECVIHADQISTTEPLRIGGLHNILFLGGIIGAVLMSGMADLGSVHVLGIELAIEALLRDFLIVLMGVLSLVTTSAKMRTDNEFSWFPILEVAYLFAGIFMTIIPALAILKAGENGHLAFLIRIVQEPYQYFWVTGALSSFLDNAPTYLTFFNTVLGQFYPGVPEHDAVVMLLNEHARYLMAIGAGAVFMGAMTYIGNAPNFMVRSIAEESGINMPSFFGYMFKWSMPILLPLFVLVTLVFFLF